MRILEWKCMKLDNISLNCVPECQINITPTLHQMMAWCDEPLSQPMRFSLLTHIYVLLKWKHISRHWPFVQGIHRFDRWIPRTKGKWRGALMLFFFICALTNDWANNLDAGDLRRHRSRYDVTVMENYQWTRWHEHNLGAMHGCLLSIQRHAFVCLR